MMMLSHRCIFVLAVKLAILTVCSCYVPSSRTTFFFRPQRPLAAASFGPLRAAAAGKGFGSPSKSSSGASSKKKAKTDKKKKKTPSNNMPYVKAEQEDMLNSLAAAASQTCIGRAVSESLQGMADEEKDPFWELMPSLLSSRFPNARDDEFQRVAGFLRYAIKPSLQLLEKDIIDDPMRPHEEIHAYMPGLGPRQPFLETNQVELCRQLSENIDVIEQEYHALLNEMESEGGKDRFQSVTSMNYESGWKTLVLFYNSHRIPDFPYHLCPVTTRILESVPLAGRIAGFNRQQPQTGIPLHSDGNNMWLTCQMGVIVPDDEMAHIRVGSETRHWKRGECLLYDTTYEHETMNAHPTQERVVLHVDFFNTLAMTPLEIEVLRYIYSLREEFMKAEGVTKVGAQIL